jgi:hypothetical protein
MRHAGSARFQVLGDGQVLAQTDVSDRRENWGFETGFMRNEEAQWYQPQNASVVV